MFWQSNRVYSLIGMFEDRQGGEEVEIVNIYYFFNEICYKGQKRKMGIFWIKILG